MGSDFSIHVIEPKSQKKLKRLFRTMVEKQPPPEFDQKEAEERLAEIRLYSLGNNEALIGQLADRLAILKDVEQVFAADAHIAIEHILRIANGQKDISVNRSDVIRRELYTELKKAGFNIIESYLHEYQKFDPRFNQYWQLPSIDQNQTVQSYEEASSLSLEELASTPSVSMEGIGLLGVNAIAADDGSIFFLQNFTNITKILEQAEKLVFVVGIDKIVKSREDASFLTRCMAIYGAESIDLELRPEKGLKSEPGDLSITESDTATDLGALKNRSISVVLLDNGRSKILQSPYRRLLECIGCRSCIVECPTYQFFSGEAVLSPRNYLYSFLLDDNPSLDLCLGCGACQSRCPLRIEIPRMMGEARASKRKSLSDILLTNFEQTAKWGRPLAPVLNKMFGSGIIRDILEKVVGINKQRSFPRYQRQTLRSKFIARGNQPASSGRMDSSEPST